MTVVTQVEGRNPRALCIGPLSPPVTGQAVVHAEMMALLRAAHFSVEPLNTAAPALGAAKWRRLGRYMHALYQYVRLTFRQQHDIIYLTMDAGPGMYFQCLIAVLAHLSKNRLAAHHHSYFYINEKTLNFSMFCWLAGAKVQHIVNSETMLQDMKSAYRRLKRIDVVSNILFSPSVTAGTETRRLSTPMVLGHLSNLSEAKGIDLVADVLAECQKRRLPVTLKVAGPIIDDVARQSIARMERHNMPLAYLGAVDGEQKKAFFRSIDLFLFPTKYKVEATPLVLFEAQAFGVPIVALRRGSIDRRTYGPTAHIIEEPAQFVSRTVEVIEEYLDGRRAYPEDVRQTLEFHRAQRQQAADDLQDLLTSLVSG